MAKSRARFLAELLGSDGLVKATTSSLAGADGIIDLEVLPSIPNSKLTNSSITINSSATSLGGSVTLTTANVAENTNLYYTNARADARIAAATTDDLSEGSSNLYYTDARADARVALIVDSAPGTLNTLNELAAALGDDANFSTTVTNSIATKLPLAGGTMTGNLNLGDNIKAQFGADNDLQIYHDGSNSFIQESGTGALKIRSNKIRMEAPDSQNMIIVTEDAGVQAFYNGTERLSVTNTGIDVTGTVTAESLGIGTTAVSSFAINDLVVGSGSSVHGMTIYTGTSHEGIIRFADGTSGVQQYAGQVKYNHSNNSLNFYTNGSGTIRLALDSSGNATFSGDIDVDGTTNLDVVDIDGAVDFGSTTAHAGNATFADNAKAIFGAGSDLQIYHNGSKSIIHDFGTGNLEILADDFVIKNSTGVNTLFFADAPNGQVSLYHSNAAKLSTTATGIDVTGVITSDGLTLQTSENTVSWASGNGVIEAPSNLYLRSTGSGTIYLQDNVDITGTATMDGLTVDAGSGADAVSNLKMGTSNSGANKSSINFQNSVGSEIFAIDYTNTGTTLDINSDIGGSILTFTRPGGIVINQDGNDHDIRIESDTNTNAFFFEGSSGNVGIGTDNPKTTLNLAANNSGQGPILTLENSDTSITTNDVLGQIDFYGNDGSTGGTGQKATIQAIALNSSGTSVGLAFGTSPFPNTTATERMRIDSSGNVGIGTDSPDLLYEGLHIKSANPSLKIEGTGTNSWEFIHLKQPNHDRLIGMRTTGNIVINSGTNLDANNMLVIDTAGKVGINVENPVHDLDVAGTAKADQYLIDAIAESNTDTAVDVFVYDTRKDSDGGAWRKRTQNTSWYNET